MSIMFAIWVFQNTCGVRLFPWHLTQSIGCPLESWNLALLQIDYWSSSHIFASLLLYLWKSLVALHLSTSINKTLLNLILNQQSVYLLGILLNKNSTNVIILFQINLLWLWMWHFSKTNLISPKIIIRERVLREKILFGKWWNPYPCHYHVTHKNPI